MNILTEQRVVRPRSVRATTTFSRNRFEIAMGSLALLYLLLFAGIPLIYNVVLSFQQVDLMSPAFFVRPFVGLANYLDVMSRPESRIVVVNTVLFVALSLVFQISIGLLLALLFMQRFPAASFLRGLFLAGWIMPGLVVGAIWKLVFAGDYGVLNHLLISAGLIHAKIFWLSDPHFALYAVIIANIWLGVPFNMLLLSVGLIGIPAEIYEAAKIDGAGPVRRFFAMTLPMMRSTLGAVVSLGAIMTMQQFDLIAALTQGGPANSSQVAQYWSWQLSFQTFEVAQGSAVATVMLVLVLIVAVVYVRSIRHETTA
ncbi:Sugar ABC transporter permease [Pararobbsia alpina]|uniref:carbohydrate ABC transporter permease n=1 Tax=Pararobbsia alpina TaxID=621374 RepID=UPI0039A59BAC